MKSGEVPVSMSIVASATGSLLKYHENTGAGEPRAWQVRLMESDMFTLTFIDIAGNMISVAAVEGGERGDSECWREDVREGKREGRLTKDDELCSVIVIAQVISGLTGIVGSV